MIKIAHRGNVSGPLLDFENNPEYLLSAIGKGYDVEVDVWCKNEAIYFGHDKPQYHVIKDNFSKIAPHAWFHCKDLYTLRHFAKFYQNTNYFWHQTDFFTLTNKNFIWTYPNNKTTDISILVDLDLSSGIEYNGVYGICTDYPDFLGSDNRKAVK
jgi:hypothetical protein